MSMAPDIRLENLTVGYGEKVVLSDLNLDLPGGRISMIVGPSGCGKSTLLKHVLRLHRPMTGKIFLGRHEVFSLSGKASRCLKQKIGVLFQDGALLGSLNLKDNIALPLREHTRLSEAEIDKIVREKLGLVGLGHVLDLYPNELSGGMRKRAGLARGLVMDPVILFCDEPTSGLDPIMSAELDQLLLEMKGRFDMTMVVVSHDLESMRTIADHVVVLGKGRALFSGSIEELESADDPYLRQFLDRMADERDAPRMTLPPIDSSVMKIDCSRHLGEMDG